ncbi:hypothetical protein GGS23DRAFT_545017 [Durotheca rogersii]|uniref:uncharacterized protein n=1 Tax=Durotheca rogersii TaxID=419775 RepID=UPI0022207C63|nr:uncharacterized protein GGS23DRAFT_545017 [Durotheca rogersii]KAI5868344.1 hypothetical protein GGS23DRAFT_545017 [Durotheca rogersii]
MASSPVKNIDGASAEEPTLPPASSLSGTASMKRPAPTLLPPFEPLSSSPGFPRPSKRQARDRTIGSNAFLKYPTPIPTSSTGILSSSPPRVQPSLEGPQSAVSERAPLSAVPSVELNENGETLLMGRSTNSSHYQLSANRHISRIHVKARYIPASTPLEPNKVEVLCNGWNGAKLHCQGRTWELAKGDSFVSETENADIMLDVEDARVMVHWPKRDRRESIANLSDSSWDESPRSRGRANGPASDFLQSSPLRRQTRIQSPESPTPANNRPSSNLDDLLLANDTSEPVQIYEDASGDEHEHLKSTPAVDVSFAQTEIANSFSSDLSDPDDDDNDPDEENDPIVHSFGPFGANLSNRLAAFTAASPKQPRHKLLADVSAKPPTGQEPEEKFPDHVDADAVRNHVVNQLAFSRLSSNPLSGILNNLPAEEKKDLTKPTLRRIIETTPCIGVIARQGKDAAGQPLESEYYYISERDTDESRRVAVTDGLRKPSLRACRKQHKVFSPVRELMSGNVGC